MKGTTSEKFQGYKSDANEAIRFKLVRTEKDIDSDDYFHPDMTHQLFGEKETIFGYKDLKIDIFCTAANLYTYIRVKYSEKIDPAKADGVEADNVLKMLSQEYTDGLITNVDDFSMKLMKDENFKPFGKKIHSYTRLHESKEKTFSIYQSSIEDDGFRSFHSRMQPFLLFFVDAGSYIDTDDEKWNYYVLYEEYKSAEGKLLYAFVGYMTIYNYYAYPEHIRPRISQVIVLPPYQRMGHCVQLVETFYNLSSGDKMIKDITVEDPSENFQRVRDFIDARNCEKLESYQPCFLKACFTEDMYEEANKKFKLCRRQARRIYEILRLACTDRGNKEEYKAYRLDIKKRLYAPYHKSVRDFAKLKRALCYTEFANALHNSTNDQKKEYLSKAYEELEIEYLKVISRLVIGQ
ncbi:DgyrCDS11227 [Dimorphilus gyrociliatus]|uniref:Histone acetyltransferase type B catalytic subunit n=1 Tax=Dimorphilus gyrociliatus TaxID=2664684 RepID=A0A7I8W565_9ANNE|nr:DgyrCDS11227 [Dimorphilus gyrociliatus]